MKKYGRFRPNTDHTSHFCTVMLAVQTSKPPPPFRQAYQFTVAPPQHFLYFFPELQGHGAFRRGSLRWAPQLTGRCALKYRQASFLHSQSHPTRCPIGDPDALGRN
jgi:hypothetical protein